MNKNYNKTTVSQCNYLKLCTKALWIYGYDGLHSHLDTFWNLESCRKNVTMRDYPLCTSLWSCLWGLVFLADVGRSCPPFPLQWALKCIRGEKVRWILAHKHSCTHFLCSWLWCDLIRCSKFLLPWLSCSGQWTM